jgi:DNA-directed RNA polymerase specialized sigma24 family protein
LKLSDNEKLIIEYHYGEDLALKEIAVILGENYETLKKRHFRLLKKVGKLYEKIKVKKN